MAKAKWSSFTLDLHAEMPYWSLPKDKRAELWDDGLHFTEAGYDLMGSIIAERLVQLSSGSEGVGETTKHTVQHPMNVGL